MLFTPVINLDAKNTGLRQEFYVFKTPWGAKKKGATIYDVAFTLESFSTANIEKSINNPRIQIYTGTGAGLGRLAPTDKRVIADCKINQTSGTGKLLVSGIWPDYVAREDAVVDSTITIFVEYGKNLASDYLRFGVRLYYQESSLSILDYLRLLGR